MAKSSFGEKIKPSRLPLLSVFIFHAVGIAAGSVITRDILVSQLIKLEAQRNMQVKASLLLMSK